MRGIGTRAVEDTVLKFGPVRVAAAEGATLVHGQTLGGRRYRKGHVLGTDDIAHLRGAGVKTLTVAILEADDVSENAAARRLAEAVAGEGVRTGVEGTGRVNLFAERDGLVVLDPGAIDRINMVDEGLTIATLRPLDRVEANQIVATVKVIPFSIRETALRAAEEAAYGGERPIGVRPYARRRIGLLQTRLPGLKETVATKTSAVVRTRVEALGSEFAADRITEHDEPAIAEALRAMIEDGIEMILVIGASATTDRRDVIPAAIATAGGGIDHFGMPVDPGNLLVIARIGAVPVLALPGSARSPRIGGNDIVLERILARIPVDSAHVMAMGVGGLLKEIPSRPLPRAAAAPRETPQAGAVPRIAAVILGAGQSRRMGTINKLLIEVDGRTMIRHAIEAAKEAGADPVVVVTGHEAEAVREAAGTDVVFVHNPDYGLGLSTSLRAGIAALPEGCEAALVALGDMPRVTAAHIARLIEAFEPNAGRAICVPTWQGKRGNPVLWDRRFFDEMATLDGDVGAKHLIGEHVDAVVEVPMYDAGILIDVDSPAALADLDRSAKE